MAPKWQRVSKSNSDHEMSSSQSIHETMKGSHEFKIKGYSLSKGMGVGTYMSSGKFTVGGHEWAILFNPDGNTEDCKDPRKQVRAVYEFELLDQSGKTKYVTGSMGSPMTFNTGSSIWGKLRFMKRSDFETSTYLKDDCLIIICTIGVVRNHVETMQPRFHEGKHYVILVPPSDMILNLKAQFLGLVGNPDMETVAIEEFDPFAFKAMLLFLYSDELPEPRELSDLDPFCTSTTIIQHLLFAADRFVLARLKLMCESKLCSEITADIVATTLALGDHHHCLQLKTSCLNFAAEPENVGGECYIYISDKVVS
ncbi:hypothetical protein MKW92_033826 [Papaver armeniacum]|nr:hypothetical protein MKW92_033826 [Papaver armeniacum]